MMTYDATGPLVLQDSATKYAFCVFLTSGSKSSGVLQTIFSLILLAFILENELNGEGFWKKIKFVYYEGAPHAPLSDILKTFSVFSTSKLNNIGVSHNSFCLSGL